MSTFGLNDAGMSPSEKEQLLSWNISVSAFYDKSSNIMIIGQLSENPL